MLTRDDGLQVNLGVGGCRREGKADRVVDVAASDVAQMDKMAGFLHVAEVFRQLFGRHRDHSA